MKYTDYIRAERLPTLWCPGCGYGQVMNSMVRAFEKAGLGLENTVIVSGVGCWGFVDSYLRVNAFHGTHGRALAFATGIKLANPQLDVIVVMGDGDGVTIGGNHFIHACRRNIDVTAIVCNNFNYGMTGGQYSGTTPEDAITATSRYGHIEPGLDICKLAEAAGAHYVARSISEDVERTANMIRDGIRKKGFSLIEAICPCPTYYGRNNQLRDPVELFRWVKDNSIPVEDAAGVSPGELKDKFVTGVLVDKTGVDYGARYLGIREKAMSAAAKEREGAGS